MFGLEDPAIAAVYLLCILSATVCVIYGVVNWNKGDEPVRPEDKKWVTDELAVNETL